MGHHPPMGAQTTELTSSAGISSETWFIILVGIAVLIYLIYRFTKKK